jgi:hypothetical protein
VTTTLSPRRESSRRTNPSATRLAERFLKALDDGEESLAGLIAVEPHDRRDRFTTLLAIYGLRLGPLTPNTRYAEHPAVAAIKWRLEGEWVAELLRLDTAAPQDPDRVARTLRKLAARDRLPDVYRWVAEEASWDDVVRFLALEGGPDAGFDDLVAMCQIGLSGSAKLELATNYWDEMGNGEIAAVHTNLHDQLVHAVGITAVPQSEQPESALARSALGGLLATNRSLQPEMLGALGLTELQAGPRCRMVLRAFDRCNAPHEAYPFYRVHADVDPRHGKDWVDNAILPVVAEHPAWAARIIRGAVWRSHTNAAFFADVDAAMKCASAAA